LLFPFELFTLFGQEDFFSEFPSRSFCKFYDKDQRKQKKQRNQIAHRPLPFIWDVRVTSPGG
jgi:hypothetical protein